MPKSHPAADADADADARATGLPHAPLSGTSRCWCGGRWCILRDRLRRHGLAALRPAAALLLLAATTGLVVAATLAAAGWPSDFGALAGAVVGVLVVASASVVD